MSARGRRQVHRSDVVSIVVVRFFGRFFVVVFAWAPMSGQGVRRTAAACRRALKVD
jgi:hypothetical protein